MFGRNPNAFNSWSQFPQNNVPMFNPYAFQQNNILNFQYQNQTFINNSNSNQQQFPNQNQFETQMITPINNQQDSRPNFEQFLNDAEQFSENSISESTKHTYESNIHVYESVMAIFGQQSYPITIDKLKVFLTYQAREGGMTINTLKSYITALSYYFRSNNLNNLILSNEFKKFKSGLQRSFKENSSPYAKLPFKPEFFLRFLQNYDMNDIDNVKMMFYMSLSFYGFLRISELLNLKKKDFVYDVEKNKLIITIRFSKTDQNGIGATTYLYNNTNKIYHPLNFIGFLSNLDNEDSIVDITEDHLRKKLNDVLIQLGLDPTKYS